MVTEIKEKEVMTLRELKKKFSTKWFQYVIVGDINYYDPDSEMCYVVLTADSEEEVYKAHHPDCDINHSGIASGYDFPFTPEVGGIYVHG